MYKSDADLIREAQAPRKASDKALKYMRGLYQSREWTEKVQALPEIWQSLFHEMASNPSRDYASSDCSKFIDLLLTCDIKSDRPTPGGVRAVPGSAEAANPPVTDGIYRKAAHPRAGGDPKFYKVYWNREGNRLLAKEIVLLRESWTEHHPDGTESRHAAMSELVYKGAAHRFVTADDLYEPTLEEAIAFGPRYGRCALCGRVLNNEVSVALSIGPVCGGRKFGEEFKVYAKMAQAKLKGEDMIIDEDGRKTLEDEDLDKMTPEELRARLAELKEELGHE